MNRHDVFISYSRTDSKIVRTFVTRFEQAGLRVWIDKDGIESGDAFKHIIVNAIESSSVVVFFSSEASNSSPWTAKEIGVASSLKKHIIPVLLDSSSYNKEILFDLVNTDYVDCTNVADREIVIERLLKSLSKICSTQIQNTPVPSGKGGTKLGQKHKRLTYVSIGVCILLVAAAILFLLRPKEDTPTLVQAADSQQKMEIEVGTSRITMCYVCPGSFWMGAQKADAKGINYNKDAGGEEGPVHRVSLDGFYIGETEVTQSLWKSVMGNDSLPAWTEEVGLGDDYPAYFVSFTAVQVFLAKLNAITGCQFRLPTEAEWEWAAKGGHDESYTYSGSNNIDLVANFDKKDGAKRQLQKVGQKQPNELMLYDMSGNVWEWCNDFYSMSYDKDSVHNPKGPSMGNVHVNRGGAFESMHYRCRVSSRRSRPTDYSSIHLGFRLALTP